MARNPGLVVRLAAHLHRLQWDRAFDGAESFLDAKGMQTQTLLQWDRAFDGAESVFEDLTMASSYVLQWDRAFDGAESRDGSTGSKTHPRGFNGTAPLMARNQDGDVW